VEFGVVGVRLGVHRVVLAVNVHVEVQGLGGKAVGPVEANVLVPEGQKTQPDYALVKTNNSSL